jgi:hypothetical protein
MRCIRSAADDHYIGRRRKERGKGLRVCRAHRTGHARPGEPVRRRFSTTSSAGPEPWPMLMVTWLGGGPIQLALGLARELRPAERGCGSWRRPGSPGVPGARLRAGRPPASAEIDARHRASHGRGARGGRVSVEADRREKCQARPPPRRRHRGAGPRGRAVLRRQGQAPVSDLGDGQHHHPEDVHRCYLLQDPLHRFRCPACESAPVGSLVGKRKAWTSRGHQRPGGAVPVLDQGAGAFRVAEVLEAAHGHAADGFGYQPPIRGAAANGRCEVARYW